MEDPTWMRQNPEPLGTALWHTNKPRCHAASGVKSDSAMAVPHPELLITFRASRRSIRTCRLWCSAKSPRNPHQLRSSFRVVLPFTGAESDFPKESTRSPSGLWGIFAEGAFQNLLVVPTTTPPGRERSRQASAKSQSNARQSDT